MLPSFLVIIAAAQAQVPVLISELELQDPAHGAIGIRLPGVLTKPLISRPDLEVLLPSDVPYIQGVRGDAFIRDCPAEQVLGCTFDLAEVAQARWAVTGIVRWERLSEEDEEAGVEPGVELELSVLDIEEQAEAWSLLAPHSRETEAFLAERVAEAVVALAAGEQPPQPEAPPEPELEEPEEQDPERDLDSLQQEMGEVGHPGGVDYDLDDSGPTRTLRPPLTLEQLLEEQGDDEPWEALDLTPEDYVRWWNSGWDLVTWRDRAQGRRGRVLFRGWGGAGWGPRGATYDGRYAIEDFTRDLLATYTYQSVDASLGSSVGLGIGVGLTPALELELFFSREGGAFQTEISKEWVTADGNETETMVSSDKQQGSLQAGLGVRLAPLPVSDIRPLVGAGVALWRGSTVSAHENLPDGSGLPGLSAPLGLAVHLAPGVEYRLNRSADAWLQVPLQGFLVGGDPQVDDQSGRYLEDIVTPSSGPPFGAGVVAGIQLRTGP